MLNVWKQKRASFEFFIEINFGPVTNCDQIQMQQIIVKIMFITSIDRMSISIYVNIES